MRTKKGKIAKVEDGFFFHAKDGIRDAQESRGLGDVYKRQHHLRDEADREGQRAEHRQAERIDDRMGCLLYTSDAADDLLRVDPGGRPIIKKKSTGRVRTAKP